MNLFINLTFVRNKGSLYGLRIYICVLETHIGVLYVTIVIQLFLPRPLALNLENVE